jgi:hypothetical protein
MSVLLPKRGSGVLEAGIVYEVQQFPCVLYVAIPVGAEQSNTETFDVSIPIVFSENNHAEIFHPFIRLNATVNAAIKKDPFSPVKR